MKNRNAVTSPVLVCSRYSIKVSFLALLSTWLPCVLLSEVLDYLPRSYHFLSWTPPPRAPAFSLCITGSHTKILNLFILQKSFLPSKGKLLMESWQMTLSSQVEINRLKIYLRVGESTVEHEWVPVTGKGWWQFVFLLDVDVAGEKLECISHLEELKLKKWCCGFQLCSYNGRLVAFWSNFVNIYRKMT